MVNFFPFVVIAIKFYLIHKKSSYSNMPILTSIFGKDVTKLCYFAFKLIFLLNILVLFEVLR